MLSCSQNHQTKKKPVLKFHDIETPIDSACLYGVPNDRGIHLGDSVAYLNQNGDTVIPLGKYSHCWTDTVKYFGIVYDSEATKGTVVAIDQKQNFLFEVYLFDNTPDILQEGLFRVKRNGKIGFANKYGQVVIPCQFQCAYPFENGKAKVTYNCTKSIPDEHKPPQSDSWFFIDKIGNKI